MTKIDIHFNRLGQTGATLVVVSVGTETYGATGADPLAALRVVARKASEGLAARGCYVDPNLIVERGCRQWTSYRQGIL